VNCFLGAFVEMRKATISFMSVCPHGTTRLPLDGFSWNLIYKCFSKLYPYFFIWIYLPCIFFILYYDQQMHNSLSNCHTPTCFDFIVSSSGSLKSIPCQVTQCIWIKPMWIFLIINCKTNSCTRNTCVTWQGIDYSLSEDDTIVSKYVGVWLFVR
jgi:hypothetical protein